MKIYFLEGIQPSGGAGEIPVTAADIPMTWRRPLAVAAASILAATLHGLVWVWYVNRPEPALLTKATPLPMIDIALSAPPAAPQPVVSSPPQPPKLPQPAKKPKPKPVKKLKPVRKESEVKRVELQKEEPEPDSAATEPATPPAPAAPVQERAASPRNEIFTPASSNANYLNNPRPVYPGIARSRHWEGLVLLRVHVTEDGHCGELSVQRSSGHEVLDESALEAVRKWRFVPAKRGDVAQASWVTVPIEFQLE